MGNQHYGLARVFAKGRVTIPKKVRRILGINDGDTLAVYIDGGDIIYLPVDIIPKYSQGLPPSQKVSQ